MLNQWIRFVVAALMPMVSALPAALAQQPHPNTGGPVAGGKPTSQPLQPAADAGAKVTGTIGFVDLDRVSAQVNWKSEFENDYKAAQLEAERQVTVYRETVLAAWEAKKKAIADATHLNPDQVKALNSLNATEIQKLPLTQAQRDDLGQSFGQANQALNEAHQRQVQMVNEREQRIVESAREAMRPSVRRVATAAHITMVIAPPPNANPVFYYDPSVDLTDAVVDDLRKAMPQHAIPEMPRLNLPTEFRFSSTAPSQPRPTAPDAAPGARPESQ